MNPTKEFIDQLHKEDIEQAKRMTPEQKFFAGGELFDDACQWTLAGIRHQNPGISDEAALEEVRRRIRDSERRETRA
jgi:hypothetical protein